MHVFYDRLFKLLQFWIFQKIFCRTYCFNFFKVIYYFNFKKKKNRNAEKYLLYRYSLFSLQIKLFLDKERSP